MWAVEEQDAATFTVRLSSPQLDEVAVTYATRDGTAQAGSDYLAMEGTLVFAAGETENTITVPILNNDPQEENEFFNLVVNTLANDTATFNTGVALIRNNPELVPDIQNIMFTSPGPLELLVGNTIQNVILASTEVGSGALMYESSDPQIATVDSAGTVTALAAGSVTIMATKAADPIYPLSVASYQLDITDVTEPALAGLGNQTFIIGEAISPLRFFNEGGGSLTSCQQTDLPTGLIVERVDNNNTCEISGTPTILQSATNHTILATNNAGSSTTSVTITVVNPDAPQLEEVALQTYSIGSAIPTLTLSNSGGGSLIECSDVQGGLPAGLTVSVSSDRSTCEISGTPTTLQVATSVDILARNVTASSTVSFSIEVLAAIDAPSLGAVAPQVYTLRETITALRLPNSGGELTACDPLTTLPDGLILAVTNDRTTCEILGTPTTILPAMDYEIRATNRQGSSDTTLFITVNDIVFTESLTFAYANSATLNIGLAVTSGTARVDWGDGSPTVDVTNQDLTQLTAAQAFYSYPTTMNVNVTISFSDGVASLRGLRTTPSSASRLTVDMDSFLSASNVEVLSFGSLSNLVTGDIANLAFNTPALRELRVGRGGDFSGDISSLPLGLSILTLANAQGTFSGSIDNLPPNMTLFSLSESNNISGDIGNLPATLQSFTLEGGRNTVTGVIDNLPSTLTLFDLQGLNTVSGNIDNINSGFTRFDVGGRNTIGGDITNVSPFGELALSVQGDNTITGDIAGISSFITSLQIFNGDNTLFGNIQDLHANMRTFFVTGNNTIAGDIGGLPANLNSFFLIGQNTVAGNIQDVSTDMTTFFVDGQNTITGDIGLLDPGQLSQFEVRGQNSIGGDITNLLTSTTITRVIVEGVNTITGDLSAITNGQLSSLIIQGNNTLTGNLNNVLASPDLTRVEIDGDNTLTGDISALNGSRVSSFELGGRNTFTGDIGTLNSASLILLNVGGQNTLFGDLGLMTISNPDTIEISGLNAINQFTIPSNWTPPNLFRRLVLTGGVPGQGFDAATVDGVLTFINDNTGGTSSTRNVSISRVGDAPRTAASDTAVNGLELKNFEINTNPVPM